MTNRALHELDAGTIVGLVRAREVSCREVVLAHLARTEHLEPRLGAVTVQLRESALSEADSLDRGLARGGAVEASAPLLGVPVTVKENVDCLGSATTHGVPVLREAMPHLDAPAVARLKNAGAVVVGRTNQSEMGLRLCTDNPLRGRTLNPYDRRLTVGGSSGGDAVAVACGEAAIGLGNDMGGSLRVPAACAGVCTLKPTTGRIAHASSLPPYDFGPAAQVMHAMGPVARSIDDVARAYGVLAGRDVRDPRSLDVPHVGPPPEVLRAALVTRLPGAPLGRDVRATIERAGRILEAAGWEVEEAAPPEISRVNEVFGKLLANDVEVVLAETRPHLSERLGSHLERIVARYAGSKLSTYRLATERSRLARAWSGFFSEHAVAIGPTFASDVWPIDADLDPSRGLDLLEETVRFVAPGNVLGLPCLAMPMGIVEGLPTGIQIVGDLYREDLCFAAARLVEREVGPARVIEPLVSVR